MKPTYEELEEEIRLLKTELGIQRKKDEVHALARAFHITAGESAVLLALFNARTGLSGELLAKACVIHDWADKSPQAGAVRVVRLRHKLGREAIVTNWGLGYALAPPARERVKEALDGLRN